MSIKVRISLLFILGFTFLAVAAFSQNQDVNPYGGVYYNDHSNYRMYGADVLTRTTRAACEARTNVIKGDHCYDTLAQEILFYNGSAWVALIAGGGNSLDQAYDQGGAGLGRIITVDAGAVELTGEGQDKLFEAKDTTDSFSNSFFQMYGNGSFRTGGGADMSMMGLGNGIDYPYATPAFASFIAGLNNDVTGVGATSVGNAVVGGADNIINESFVSSITGGYSNRINGGISCAIIASDQCVADSGVSIVASSYQSDASGDHATVLNAYRGYARYYHQFMMGSQPIVDTTGFLFHTSSNWQLNNKTFTIGNGGVDEPTPIRMTNSITQIANGNMLIGTHWRDTYDDLDTNSAIFTVLGDSVGNADGLIFEVLKQDLDTVFRVSESGLRIKDGTQGDGKVLTSDATGNATWQDAATLDFSTVPAYTDNTAAEAVLGAGKLYYTDVAGEYMLKVTH